MPYTFHSAKLAKRFDEGELRRLATFKRRALALIETRDKLKLGQMSGSFWEDDGCYDGDVSLPDETKLKALFMDFRFFFLEKEPANCRRIADMLAKNGDNELITLFIKYIKKEWDSSFLKDGWFRYKERNLSSKEVINLWFNAHYFHSDHEKEQQLKELNLVLSDGVSRFILVMCVLDAGHSIKNLYHLIKNTDNDNLVMQIPTLCTLKSLSQER